jgi:molybdate transport system regulatory protein
MEMSYMLHRGGKEQGGAALTDTVREVLALYRESMAAAEKASKPALRKIRRLLSSDGTDSSL